MGGGARRTCCWFEGGGSCPFCELRERDCELVFDVVVERSGRKESGDARRGRASKYWESSKEGSSSKLLLGFIGGSVRES